MKVSLAAVLALAAVLRAWRLTSNGVGTEYYAAAVRSMLDGWHNFLYASFDPAGFVSVDKPPVALWIQVASARLFGYNGLALIGPEVVEGVAAVALLYILVRRDFGIGAGLLAALFLAMTPVSVAIDRSSNTDSCLVLVLLLAAWALLRAVAHGRSRWLLVAMTLVALGFNIKMMAAFVVLPTFVATWLLAAPVAGRRRLVDVALGSVLLAIISLAWVVLYDLTPVERRPYVGGSRTNSMAELAVGHNGLQRFAARPVATRATPGEPPPAVGSGSGADGRGTVGSVAAPRRLILGFGDRVPPGPLRLFHPHLAAQVAWLLPLAMIGLMLGGLGPNVRASRVSVALWAGWLVMYGIVYSATRDIFHSYYLSTMAPPLSALAAIGVAASWSRYIRRDHAGWLLPAGVLLTALWQVCIQAGAVLFRREARPTGSVGALLHAIGQPDDWRGWLTLAMLAGVVLSALALWLVAMSARWSRAPRAVPAGALGVGLLALLIVPAAWALSSVLSAGNLMLPSANVNRLLVAERIAAARDRARADATVRSEKLVAFLRANRSGERFLIGTPSAPLAAPIIVRTGEPVMAMGGFHGEDPILTPETLERLITARQIRFVLVGDDGGFGWRPGGEAANLAVADWIRTNGTIVDPALWRTDFPAGAARRSRLRIGGMQLYDLRPGVGLVTPSS